MHSATPTQKSRAEISAWLARHVLDQQQRVWAGQRTVLADFGIDSLSAVELLCALDRWLGVAVPADLLADVAHTDALIDAIEALQNLPALPTDQMSDYARCVNPYLAAKLAQLKIDRRFTRADGAWLFDSDGHRCLDFMSQYGALPFGHHPVQIWQALQGLREDAEPVFCQPSLAPSAGALARVLLQHAPAGLRHVTFSNSGAEAVEAALKMARHATGRAGILSTRRGFHGKTFAALSATGNPGYQQPFGLPLADFDNIEYGDIAALQAQLEKRAGQYAAFIVEVIQGEGGVRVAPPGYLRAAQQACQRHGTLLVIDEVQTGLGRTGRLFACDDEGVVPDILTLAKALGGGLVPVGATLANDAAYSEAFALKHSSTFAGNALAARAGLATLALLLHDDSALLRHVQVEGAWLRQRLEQIQARHPWLLTEVRGRGFMLGLCLTRDRSRWPESFLGIAAESGDLAQFVASYLLNVEGLRLAPTLNGSNVLRVQPPLNATHAQCVLAADALERCFDVVATGHTGHFFRAILRRQAPAAHALPSSLPPSVALPKPAVKPAGKAQRFAFLLHPLDETGYADYDPSLAVLQPAELREFATSMAGLLEPVVGSTVHIQSATGARAQGDFILISHTAEQLKQLPQREALAVLNKGIALAQQRGAAIVGLGAYTSVVSGGGAQLANSHTRLTSGNSYTVVSAMEALDAALAQRGQHWQHCSVGIVGAAGAIGSCLALLLAERAQRLVLIGNPAHTPAAGRARLRVVARAAVVHVLAHAAAIAQAQPDTPSFARHILQASTAGLDIDSMLASLEQDGSLILAGSIHAAAVAQVLVTATSFPGNLVDDDLLAHGALVCDISRPRSIGRSILQRRPDVLVIDGGVIALPGRPRIGPYGLEDGSSYACMAETMLLALDGPCRDTSLGATLDVAEVKRQQLLARRHGFALASPRSFGLPLPPLAGVVDARPVLATAL